MSIYVNVVNQKLLIASSFDNIVSGSQEFVKFRFNLGDEWNDLLTFAQFRQNGTAYNQYLDEENCACLPAEIGAGTCTLMLYGSGGTTIATTNYITLKIDSDILVTDAQSTEITQSLYNQLVARVEAITSWNGQSVADLEATTTNLQAQVNRKADATALTTEVTRARAAEQVNANAIALKADQTQVDNLAIQLGQLASNEIIAQEIQEAVQEEMATYLLSGQLAEMTIQDGSLSKAKVDAAFETTLGKADTAMQPSVYDPQNLGVDIFSYAQGRADIVQENLRAVTSELADGYNLTESLHYSKIGDAIRGSVALSRSYAQALLADYNAFTIEIVDELPVAGQDHTFYLIPKESGNGYDKYWYITDNLGDRHWDVFGASSTVVVDTLPESGETDVDYILNSSNGCLYYKWIDNGWHVVAGSLAYVSSSLPSVSDGNEFTDYYITSESNGSYIHYRLINGAYRVIGGDAYTKSEIDALISSIEDDVSANETAIQSNETNISSLSQTLTNLQQTVANLNTEGYSYYATYGNAEINGTVTPNVFTLYEVYEEVETVKSQFVISGGGGGGGQQTSTTLTVERVTSSPIVVTTTDEVNISFNYSSLDGDNEEVDGTYTWKLGNTVITSGACVHGLNTFDATDYCTIGTQKFTLSVTDEGGSSIVKTWTVQKVDVRLESAFNDRMTYDVNNAVNFTYTPYGSISKTVHFKLDGVELTSVSTSASGTLQSYSIPAQTHGAHLFECWITATINNMDVETDHIFKDIIWYDETSHIPVIGCIYRCLPVSAGAQYDANAKYYKVTDGIYSLYDGGANGWDTRPQLYYKAVSATQYDTTSMQYVVFNPNTGSPVVTRTIDGNATTQTMATYYDTLAYKTAVSGTHTIVLSCGTSPNIASIGIIMDIGALDIDVSPVTGGLAFDFNPTGKSNGDANRLWSDSNNSSVNMSVSDNFDWNNGGYQIDNDGNTYFCVKAGTRATINYNLFGTDPKSQGSEFKVIFKTTNVRDIEATFLKCIADETQVGIEMNVHDANIKSSVDTLFVPYCEDDIVEFEYNINALDTENANSQAMIMSYEDGVGLKPMVYDATHRLHQYTPVPITIGSDECDVYIYRMKAYTSALTDSNVLSNFIADARDAETMIARYDRNQIYNENNALTPEYLAEVCPQLRIIKIECPHFTNDKKDYVKNTSVECIYKGGDNVLDNWKFTNCYHAGQGTTSNEYGYAGRNIDVIMCFDGVHQFVSKIPLDSSYITQLTLGDGTKYTDGNGKVALTRNSVPNNWFNIKVNIASSENANNALLQKRYNDFLPYVTAAMRKDPKCKNSMEFVNCVVFIKESDADLSNHREFNDTNWHFYAMGNIGDSKKTDNTRVNDPDDMKEFVIEVSDNTLQNSTFQTGVAYATDITDGDGNVIHYAGDMKFPILPSEWVAGNPKYDSIDGDGWDDSFEFRYDMGGETRDGASLGMTSLEQDAQRLANKQVWRDFYRWVITSTDSEFTSELHEWFIVDSALYWYLYTERYTMTDNRAKNTFWHYGKVYISESEAAAMGTNAQYYTIDNEASAIHEGYRFEMWDYDNDTALGINNSGELTMTYGKEDIDYKTEGVASSGYVFNAAESVFWRRIRNLMHTQLSSLYQTLDSSGCWSSTSLINEFDNWQAQFPEELWRLDAERKYYRTNQGISIDNSVAGAQTPRFLYSMMNGRKKYHRRQFERDQATYMGTKYLSSTIKQDQIMFRCNTPQSAVVTPNYTLTIVPYSDMYVSVLFGNMPTTQQIRTKAGQTVSIDCPLTEMDDTAILIYAASKIQALNDISACYIHDNDFSKASKLKTLIIGNTTAGYQNSFLETLNIGNNPLLEELDIRNCPELTGSLNLASCGALETLRAEGTALTSVVFATNGKIESAYLPGTINSLTMKNLNYLTTLDVTYNNLEALTEENSVVDEYSIVVDASDTLQTLRLVGINWTLADTSLLNTILNMNSSYLSGSVYISGQVRNQELIRYANAWHDLTVAYDAQNLVPQHLITYVNADNESTVLYQAYVDQGSVPQDPYATGEISKPTLESTDKYSYEFGNEEDGEYVTGSGWNEITSVVLEPRTVTAVYTSSIRTYTVTWFSRAGLSLGSTTAQYGTEVVYNGATPTNTSEESTYIFNVFAGWDKSTGFITGDTDVYAVWERKELPATSKDLSAMTPGEIFAVTSSGRTANYFSLKDYVDITLGHDFNFSNVESYLIANNLAFNGQTAQNTSIKLFGENETSFTLAIDLQFTGTETNNTLLSCFEEDGSEGFRIRYNNGRPNVQWGDQSVPVGYSTYRDIIVLRHIKGENKLYVYASNGNSSSYSDAITRVESTRSRSTNTEATLSLGAIRFMGDGGYDDYGTGVIHWCKVWYDDLGDTNARKLAAWYHEPVRMEFCGASRYRLAGNTSQRANASFIANNLLGDRGHVMNNTNVNSGGWESSLMRTFCNTRLKEALPTVWQSMLKPVKISASAGNMSTEIVVSEDYVYLASTTEMNGSTDSTLSSEGDYITWYTSNALRAKFRGRIIPDGASYYTASSDPSTVSTNNVTAGDIWTNTGNQSIAYMYVEQDELTKFNITPAYTASIGGGWVSAYYWWLRSPNVGSTTNFWNVSSHGSCTNGGACYSSGVCPCFSI